MNDSTNTCDENIKETKKLFQQILMKKKAACKTQNVYILLAF